MNAPMPEWSGNMLALNRITLYDAICGTDNVVYDTLIGYLCKYIYRVLLNKTEYVDNSKIRQDLIRELCFIQKKL